MSCLQPYISMNVRRWSLVWYVRTANVLNVMATKPWYAMRVTEVGNAPPAMAVVAIPVTHVAKPENVVIAMAPAKKIAMIVMATDGFGSNVVLATEQGVIPSVMGMTLNVVFVMEVVITIKKIAIIVMVLAPLIVMFAMVVVNVKSAEVKDTLNVALVMVQVRVENVKEKAN